jgi:hypothetical protein
MMNVKAGSVLTGAVLEIHSVKVESAAALAVTV